MLGIDKIEAQGLLKKARIQENNLISIVTSFYEYFKTLPIETYMELLQACVYSKQKAIDVCESVEQLGKMWGYFMSDLQKRTQKPTPKDQTPQLGYQKLRLAQKQQPKTKRTQVTNIPAVLVNQTHDFSIVFQFNHLMGTSLIKKYGDGLEVRKKLEISLEEAKIITIVFVADNLRQICEKSSVDYLNSEKRERNLGVVMECFKQDPEKSAEFFRKIQRLI